MKQDSNNPKASDFNHELYKSGCKYYKEGNYKKAKKAFSESIKYWPEDPQAWFALGNCYDELNAPAKAEESFTKSLNFTAKENKSDVFYNLGNSLLDQAKFVEAIDCYTQVFAQSSVYRMAQINLERAKNKNTNKNS